MTTFLLISVLLGALYWCYDAMQDRRIYGELKQRLTDELQEQASKRNGSLSAKRLRHVRSGWPVLSVPYKTLIIYLYVIDTRSERRNLNRYTCVEVTTDMFPDKEFRVLFSKDTMFVRRKVTNLDERLPEGYVVSSRDASFVNRVMTGEVRTKLLEFVDEHLFGVKFGCRWPGLRRKRGRLVVFIDRFPYDSQICDKMIETAIIFYERLLALSSYEEQNGNCFRPIPQ